MKVLRIAIQTLFFSIATITHTQIIPQGSYPNKIASTPTILQTNASINSSPISQDNKSSDAPDVKELEDFSLENAKEIIKSDHQKSKEKKLIGQFIIRNYGSIGYTGGNMINVLQGDLTNYQYDFQFGFQFHEFFSLGIQTGYLHAFSYYNSKNPKTIFKDTALPLYEEGNYNYSYLGVFVDFLPNIFHVQLGVLPFFQLLETKKQERFYLPIQLGIHLNLGIEIPIYDILYLPMSTQFLFIFSKPIIIPIQFFIGVTLKLDFKV